MGHYRGREAHKRRKKRRRSLTHAVTYCIRYDPKMGGIEFSMRTKKKVLVWRKQPIHLDGYLVRGDDFLIPVIEGSDIEFVCLHDRRSCSFDLSKSRREG